MKEKIKNNEVFSSIKARLEQAVNYSKDKNRNSKTTEIILEQAKKELMRNSEFKKSCEEKAPVYDFIYEMIRIRKEKI